MIFSIETLQAFCDLVTADLLSHFGPEYIELHRVHSTAHYHIAKKYTRVDIGVCDNGAHGQFMIENETGRIYGIKGYGVIDRGHYYGTLDTMKDYHWGCYYGIVKKSQMK